MDLSELYQPVEEDDKGRKISQNLYDAIEVNSEFDLSCMYIATHDKVKYGLSAVSNNLESFAYNFYPQQLENPIVGWCFGRKTNGATNYWMDMSFGKGSLARPKFGSSGNTQIRVVSDINIDEYALRGISMYCYDPNNVDTNLRPVGLGYKDFTYLLENPNMLCRTGSLGLMYNFSNQSNNNLQPTMMVNGKVTGFVAPYAIFTDNSKYGVQCNYMTGVQNGGWSNSDGNYANDNSWVNYDTPDRFMEAVPTGLTYNLQDGRLENGQKFFENDVCVAYYRKDFTWRCDAIEWYYKVSWVLELIASMGVYVQTGNTSYNSLNELIDSGNCYLGEMTDEGVSTGRFLHERAEIETAYNYQINTNNSPVQPYPKPVDDDPRTELTDKFKFTSGDTVATGLNLYAGNTNTVTSLINYINTNDEGITVDDLIAIRQFVVNYPASMETVRDITIRGKSTGVMAGSVTTAVSTKLLGKVYCYPKYKDYRDYEPYCTYSLYLPFIGFVSLPTVDCVGNYLYIYVGIDNMTGQGVYEISVNDTVNTVGTYHFNCAIDLCVSAEDNTRMRSDLFNLLSAGLTAGLSATTSGVPNLSSMMRDGMSIANLSRNLEVGDYSRVHGFPSAFLTLTQTYTRPILKEIRNTFITPDNYNHTSGYPCDYTAKLGNVSGYTVCANVDVSGLDCTDTEKVMIKSYLESGVYL